MSTTISLTLLDQNGTELPFHTSIDHPIEILIPRDPALIIPPMFHQNVTSYSPSHDQLFNLHLSNLSDISVHLEVRPLSVDLSYLLVYRFDDPPILASSQRQIDGWSLFCPHSKNRSLSTFFYVADVDLSNESLFTFFVDNHQTSGHRSLIFGLRELNFMEMMQSCGSHSTRNQGPPLTNTRFNFTFDYELRLYTSGCFYLDKNNQWKSDGLTVGPLTNHYEAQCFSTHLTQFASGFKVLPEPTTLNFSFTDQLISQSNVTALLDTDQSECSRWSSFR